MRSLIIAGAAMARFARSARRDQLLTGWEHLALAGRAGPLDERTCRLLELALALGTGRREAIRAAYARALEGAASAEEVSEQIEQLLALSAGALGKHAVLAAYDWLGIDTPAPR
jgi:alkylhydroperoxidase/carboxymuconolactone decarboxylase family protein YurZ